MKKIAFLVITSIVLFSCGNPELEHKVKSLEQEKQELELLISSKDTAMSGLFADFNEIEGVLHNIDIQERNLALKMQNGVEFNSTAKERIIEEIQFLNSALEANKKKIASLLNGINKRNLNIASLNKTVASLQKRLAEKDAQVETLKTQLVNKNFKIEDLNMSLDSLTFISQLQRDALVLQQDIIETAYYCYGTSKELKENKVISKSGGVIGIGKTTTLSSDFNKEYFQKINISKLKEIDLGGVKKAKLITSHPSSSYEFVGEKKSVEKLVIKDVNAFWEASKFLVIEVE